MATPSASTRRGLYGVVPPVNDAPPLAVRQPLANVGPAPPSTYETSNLTGRQFTGHAPSATPYGDFVAPNPSELSAAAKFRLDEGLKARERSAAARGTLFNTGTLKELERFGSGLASQEYDNDFNRALAGYTTNRDTNAQNFGQATTQFRGDLDIFDANNRVGLNWANFDRAGQPSAEAGAMVPDGSTSSRMTMAGGPGSSYADDYAASVAAARAQNAAIDEMLRRPLATTPTPWAPKVHRPQGG